VWRTTLTLALVCSPNFAAAEQFQVGVLNNLAKLFFDRYMQLFFGVNCDFWMIVNTP
jgi:hypothetical protein